MFILLIRRGKHTIGDIWEADREELLSMRHIGEKTVGFFQAAYPSPQPLK